MSSNEKKTEDAIIDINAFCPMKVRRIALDGRTYEVPDIPDIPHEDFVQLATVDERVEGKSDRDAIAEYIRVIKLIVPNFDDRRVTVRRLAAMVTVLRTVAVKENPTTADEKTDTELTVQ